MMLVAQPYAYTVEQDGVASSEQFLISAASALEHQLRFLLVRCRGKNKE